MAHFLVLCRPRSRSAWLANFLSHGQHSLCMHEGMLGCGSVAHLERKLAAMPHSFTGAADTSLVHFLDELDGVFPRVPMVLVTSPPGRWHEYARRQGFPDGILQRIDRAYERAVETLVTRAMLLRVEDIDDEKTMRRVWDWIGFDEPFPAQRYEMLRGLHVEAVEHDLLQRFGQHMRAGGVVPPI